MRRFKLLLMSLSSLCLLVCCNKEVQKELHQVSITSGDYYSMFLIGNNKKGFEEKEKVQFLVYKANQEVVFDSVYYGIEEGSVTRKYECTLEEENTYSFIMPKADVKLYVDVDKTTYDITCEKNDSVTYTVLERSENKAFAGETVNFKVELKSSDYSLDSIEVKCGEKNIEFSEENSVYSFLMPKGEVKINAKTTDLTHKVNLSLSDYLSVYLYGGKSNYLPNATVKFSVNSSNDNYGLDTVKVMTGSKEITLSTYSSYYTFTMPDSDVTIVTTTKKLTKKVSITKNDNVEVTLVAGVDEYLPNATVEFSIEITNKNYELNVISLISGSTELTYSYASGVYSFTMPNADVTISVTAKEKSGPTPTNPFTSLTVFEGDWEYNDGYTLYYMTMRVEINATVLSWKLTYEYDDEYWYDSFVVTNSFNLMATGVKNSQSNLSYTYDGTNDQVKFTAKPKMSQKEMILQINREGGEIKSIHFTENLDSDFYQTKNHKLYITK